VGFETRGGGTTIFRPPDKPPRRSPMGPPFPLPDPPNRRPKMLPRGLSFRPPAAARRPRAIRPES